MKNIFNKLNELEKRVSFLYRKVFPITDPGGEDPEPDKPSIIDPALGYENISSFAYATQNVLIDMGMRCDKKVKATPIRFVCDKDVETSLNFALSFSSKANQSANVKVEAYLNGLKIHTNTKFGVTSETKLSHNITHTFIPSQRNNVVQIIVFCENDSIQTTHKINSVNTTISGKNVMILNRDDTFKVFSISTAYIFSKNSEGVSSFMIQPRTNVIMETTYTDFKLNVSSGTGEVLNSDYVYNVMTLPLISYNATAKKFTATRYSRLYLFSYQPTNKVYATNQASNQTLNERLVAAEGTEEYVACNAYHDVISKYNLGTTVLIGGINKPALSMIADVSNDIAEIKYDSKTVEGNYIYTVPCYYKQWEQTLEMPKYTIIQDDIGQNYLLDSKNATQKVLIGFGTHVYACVQLDGSINVYLGRGKNTLKKKLILNENTSLFEIDNKSEEVFENSPAIIEGFSNDYFKKSIDGKWSYELIPNEE